MTYRAIKNSQFIIDHLKYDICKYSGGNYHDTIYIELLDEDIQDLLEMAYTNDDDGNAKFQLSVGNYFRFGVLKQLQQIGTFNFHIALKYKSSRKATLLEKVKIYNRMEKRRYYSYNKIEERCITKEDILKSLRFRPFYYPEHIINNLRNMPYNCEGDESNENE